jgi:Tol biopolymer transport system component
VTSAQANGDSFAPVISGNGLFVAYTSDATNLVANDLNKSRDVFRTQLSTGATVRVSVKPSGLDANAGSFGPSISNTGQFIAFTSYASDMVLSDSNGKSDIVRRDMNLSLTSRVSIGPNMAFGNGDSDSPSITADGRYVAFASAATNLITAGQDTNDAWDIFIRDTNGAGTTTRVSISTSGVQGDGHSLTPSISGMAGS